MWIAAPSTTIKNLVRVKDIPASAFKNGTRAINLPGQTASVREMLDALEQVGGKQARELVSAKREERHEVILNTWAQRFDVSKAMEMGLVEDVSLVGLVEEYARTLRKVDGLMDGVDGVH